MRAQLDDVELSEMTGCPDAETSGLRATADWAAFREGFAGGVAFP